jgi:hypothetical protein
MTRAEAGRESVLYDFTALGRLRAGIPGLVEPEAVAVTVAN